MKRSASQPDSLAQWWDSFAQERAITADAPLARAYALWVETAGETQQEQVLPLLCLLQDLDVDAATLAAALLHACVTRSPDVQARIDREFPEQIATIVQGLGEARKIWEIHRSQQGQVAAEGLRRLLLAIVRDLRVVFILLASQLVQLRGAFGLPEAERREIAELSADIHAPLANRLGIWQLKWELEDLIFRILQPETYKRIARLLDERRIDRERFIHESVRALTQALANVGIHAEIAGRPKHIYSIWRKMQRKNLAFEDLYDIRAIRVMVEDVPSCYAALGIVHSLWQPIPKEFDDYIATPKGNNYRSLHTAVFGLEGKTLEVQIRTRDMHEHAERGVAAHWRYKEGGSGDASFERKIAWMRQLLEAREDDQTQDDDALLASFRTDVMEDRIYLLTPKGQVVDLPRGATVLDFAYHVHTELGHRTRGAKVNGRIVPLNHCPRTGDRVEILTGKQAEPRRDWLSAHQAYLTSARARHKVRHWFKQVDHERNVREGRELLERELKRLVLGSQDLERILPRLHLDRLDDLYEALALGDVSIGQVARLLHELQEPERESVLPTQPAKPGAASGGDPLSIEGVGNLMMSRARCCNPMPGDAIIGFITRGRGVSVHRRDCSNVLRHPDGDPRLVEVEWGESRKAQQYPVRMRIKAFDRRNLLRDITNVLSAGQVRVLAVNSRVDGGMTEMDLTVSVSGFDHLSVLLAKLNSVPNVTEAVRVA